ncbi:MAG: hypothetical protein NKF70_10600 [Methanobacterium sp. ERen5]|nr:MAG: hypothetical protein NKF70_10600 [Methanobacterium sp. ERen5]
MIKLKKSPQINTKTDAMKEIEAKLSSSEIIKEDPVPEIEEWTDDPQRWRLFKERYMDEFEDKLDMMDNLMTQKRGKIEVTWISIFKKK